MCIERVRAKDESGRLKLTVMSQRCYSIKCVHGWPLVHCDPSLILELCCAALLKLPALQAPRAGRSLSHVT